MKITIEGDAKEIAALLETEQTLNLKFNKEREKILDEIKNAVIKATDYQTKPLQEHET